MARVYDSGRRAHQRDTKAEAEGDGQDEAVAAREAVDADDLDAAHADGSEQEGGHAAQHAARIRIGR